jgi:diguanylate cyclase (GGDEF)-like protein/PAS domain S-box-containing protein
LFDKQVLLFTPNLEQRTAVTATLRKFGYAQLSEAETTKEAFDILSAKQIDIIICDVELGKLDGWRFARLIRSGALTVSANTPIIILSATHSERIAEATSHAFEVNRFIPFQAQETLPLILDEIFSSGNSGSPKARLLVIEDYPDTVELVKRVLNNRFEIEVAITGRAGLDAWLARRHDLVLLDVMLPEMSGREVLQEIIKTDPQQSVVMMTARSTPERAGELILDGAVDFISKPFRTEQLRRVCEIAVQREDFLVSNREFAQNQEALFHEKELAQVTLHSIADGVITTDLEGTIEYMNPVAERLSGWRRAEAAGKHVYQVLHSSNEQRIDSEYDPAAACLESSRPVYGSRTITFINREGRELKLDHVTSPIRNRKNEIIGAVMVFRDVTEAHVLEQKLEYQAKHDLLTGLTNRAAFEERLNIVLEDQLHHKVEYALCYVDLDQFKVINDTCGHIAGDQLLRQIKSIMLSKIRRHRDTLARFGGDEFVLLLEECSAEHAMRIAQVICDAIQEHRFIYDNKTFSIGASIGIVPITIETHNVNDALSMADNACYIAKEKGRGRVHLYHVNDQELIKRRGEMHVVSKINHAFEHDGFALFYQPIMDLEGYNQHHTHIEILLRMKDEDGDWISPAFFLPAAERYNVATKIDRWVVESTLRWFAHHPQALEQLTLCSINLSGLTFCDASFIGFIDQMFRQCQLPPHKFCFEITETAAIRNLQEASDFITQIKKLGCSFALDDFGSGMSSYAYLKNLPVDFLKVDGMFIKGMLDDPIDHAMVKSINDIGHVFGLKTIAEYVETNEIIAELRKIGVDFVQGYAISKPESIEGLNQRII